MSRRDTQGDILRYLVEKGPATVAALIAALPPPRPTETTVRNQLGALEARHLARRNGFEIQDNGRRATKWEATENGQWLLTEVGRQASKEIDR